MKIKVLQFKVVEKYVLRDTWSNKVLKYLFGKYDPDQYHFDVVMKIEGGKLEKDDFIELPNKVRLKVWSVDRFNIIRAKTYKFIQEDLRDYHPIEIYLVYQHRHARVN